MQLLTRYQFYVISIAIVGLLVPYDNAQLIGNNDVDSKASPFIIAIRDAGIQGLDSVMVLSLYSQSSHYLLIPPRMPS